MKKEKNLIESVNESLDADKEITPYLPDLLKDLWDLGSWPDKILEAISKLNLPRENTKILDLGCGKGAVSITIAKEFGFQTVGIDGNKEFINQAKIKAKEFGVENLCSFDFGDMRDYVKTARDFDIVVYASIGHVLGNFKEIMNSLRSAVRKNGYVIIDDGFIKSSEATKRKAYEDYLTREQTLDLLLSYNDKLISEKIITRQEIKSQNSRYMKAITKRATELINKQPELSKIILPYVENQKEECKFLENHFSGAIWLFQKTN